MTTNSKQLTVKEYITKVVPTLESVLRAQNVNIDAFRNNAVVAASSHPEIQSGDVSMASVADVCKKAAQDGVCIDGNEAALVIGWNSKTKRKEAQYRLMVGGVINKMYKSGNFKKIVANVVRENEPCTIDYVTSDVPVRHSPCLIGDPGDIIGVYCVAELTDGGWTDPIYMSKAEVEEIRANYSKQGDGQMWSKSWGEAAKKTVLHRAKKRWPLTQAVRDSLAEHDDESEIMDVIDEVGVVVEEAVKQPHPKRQTKAAAAVAQTQSSPVPDDVIDVEEVPLEEGPPV